MTSAAPFCKQHLLLRLDAARGRCVVAERGIPAGTCVMLNEPFAAVATGGHCAQCFKAAGEAAMRCSGCSSVSYCGRACQRADWTHHRALCHGLRRVIAETSGHAAPPTVQLAAEAFAQLAAQRAQPVDAGRAGTELRNLDVPMQQRLLSGGGVLALETHKGRLDVATLEGIAASALMMSRVMNFPLLPGPAEAAAAAAAAATKIGATPEAVAAAAAAAAAAVPPRTDGESDIAAVLRSAAEQAVRPKGSKTEAEELANSMFGERPLFSPPTAAEAVDIFCRLRSNVFTLCDAELRSTGIGVYPLASVLNHSCEPNCIAIYRGRTQAIRTIRHVRADEELTLSYCDVGVPTPMRLQSLREGYFFTCRCRRCQIYVDNEEQLYLPPPPPPALPEQETAAKAGAALLSSEGDICGAGSVSASAVSEEDAATAAALAQAEDERHSHTAKFSALIATVGAGGGLGTGAGDGGGRVGGDGGEVSDAEDSYMKALLAVQLAETESLLKRLRSEATRLGGVIQEVMPEPAPAPVPDAADDTGAGGGKFEGEGECKDSEGGGGRGEGKEVEAGGSGEESKKLDSSSASAAASSSSSSSAPSSSSASSSSSGTEAPFTSLSGGPGNTAAAPAGKAPPTGKDAEAAAAAASSRAREAVAALSNALSDIGETPPSVGLLAPRHSTGAGADDVAGAPSASVSALAELARSLRPVRYVPLAAFTPQDIQLLGVRCTRRSCRGVHVMLPPRPLPPAPTGAMAAAPPPDPSSTCTQCSRALAADDSLASAALQRRASKLVSLQKSGAKVNVILSAGTPLLKEMSARLTSVHFQAAAVANALVNASVGVRDWASATQNNEVAIAAFQFAYPVGHPLPALQQALHGKVLHFTYQPALAVQYFREALQVLILTHGRENELYAEISDLLAQAEAESLSDPANLPAPLRSRGAPLLDGKEGF